MYLGSDWNEKLPPTCSQCGYNLTGLEKPVCPECGTTHFWESLRKQARIVWHDLQQFDIANDLAMIGYWVLGAGAAAVAFGYIFGGESFCRFLGAVAALLAMILGTQVFRGRRIPEWAQEYIHIKPNHSRGVIVLSLGIGLLAISLLLP